MDYMFTNVVGRLPQNGDSVSSLDAASQTYTTTTFYTGLGWDNPNATLAIGHSAWFHLGAVVPEPGALEFIAVGLLSWLASYRRAIASA